MPVQGQTICRTSEAILLILIRSWVTSAPPALALAPSGFASTLISPAFMSRSEKALQATVKELQQQVDGAREAHALVVAELDVRPSFAVFATEPSLAVGPTKPVHRHRSGISFSLTKLQSVLTAPGLISPTRIRAPNQLRTGRAVGFWGL